ncbi:PAP fibrillin [Nodosilinea sp. LEGE 07088]|uniref:PAP/fibrillin family protein n=1 Tax=Nodosilinea sp. LEGE 07088 TaxID=2777968 RepID=UPI00187EFC7E|nr:PAP/fibrillin family protein [Nodosilinea sp. LEGE 07088]MBE9137487.1 PAP fibrillin [Nodosilinea sp. LEGE 07088]
MTPLHHRRTQLKAQLLQQIEALQPELALLPHEHPDIDQMICELESLTPINQPLRQEYRPLLFGSWALVYASRGTVVTRRINLPLPMPVGIRRIWQRLAGPEETGTAITSENGAVLSLPFVGELTATAQGIWQPFEEGESAQVSFGALTVQATRLLGIAGLHLPQITVPILDFLRQEALWITSYLDDDLRFGRGVTGNLFVFRR